VAAIIKISTTPMMIRGSNLESSHVKGPGGPVKGRKRGQNGRENGGREIFLRVPIILSKKRKRKGFLLET